MRVELLFWSAQKQHRNEVMNECFDRRQFGIKL